MTFGIGLGAGLKALHAARLAIQTSGQNVANANTPGYSRQRVMLQSTNPFQLGRGLQLGTGVQVSDINRIVDEGLERRLRLQVGMAAGAEVDYQRWQEIEGIFGEPDSGLSAGLGDLFGKIARLQSDPADRALRGGVVQAGKTLSQGFNLLATRLDSLKSTTFEEVRNLTRVVNNEAAAVADLNAQIVSLEANGSSANDLRDQREQHIRQIAELLETQVVERGNGSVDVLAGGYLLVANARASQLSVAKNATGGTQISLGKSSLPLTPTGGKIAALLRQSNEVGNDQIGQLDTLAHNLALEFNRIHTTGVPRSGPFQTLTSHYGAADKNNNSRRGDEILNQAGLPFDVHNGELFVTVTHRESGDLDRTRIAIDPRSMTLTELAARLDSIEHLDAAVDPAGKLRITAQSGYGFDFGTRLDSAPNTFGAFGGTQPSIATSRSGTFNLTVPSSFSVNTPTPTTINLAANEFANPAAVTVDELVTAINADLGTAATAKNIGGRLVIRSNSAGAAATLSLTDGTGAPLAALGLPAGTTFSGQANAVDVEIAGKYTGSANDQLVFVPDQDGSIGVTAGLTVGVFDTNGQRIATLNVGRGEYSPGDYIDVAEGVKVKLGPGLVSASARHAFAVDTLADSDSTDLLVALGLNSFFHGTKAADLSVNADLEADPDLLAASLSGASGDAANLVRMTSLRSTKLTSLTGSSIEDYYGDLVGNLGFQTSSAEAALSSQDQLLQHLQQQRDAVSGVSIDEEMVDLVRHQQAFEAASRFINVVNDLTTTLINMAR